MINKKKTKKINKRDKKMNKKIHKWLMSIVKAEANLKNLIMD